MTGEGLPGSGGVDRLRRGRSSHRVPAAGSGFPGFTLAHNVRSAAEVDQLLKEVAVKGGSIVKPGTRADWGGYTGYFADPDGFLWEVAWNPQFPHT